MELKLLRVGIVGSFTGTHIGGSLARAGEKIGLDVSRIDVSGATGSSRVLRAIFWRVADHRPPYLPSFGRTVRGVCASKKIDILIVTGLGPLSAPVLVEIRKSNTRLVNYLTDDPWNRHQGARWLFAALPKYDTIFSPRQSNIEDLRRLGCRDVRYLPFAYDEDLFGEVETAYDDPIGPEVLFVGGADHDRVAFMREFANAGGPKLTLAGGYWKASDVPGATVRGLLETAAIKALTRSAALNLCLVRKANRDDHVMRSFEIAASGGCMLAEDTPGHRALFGNEAEAVMYFESPVEAAQKAKSLAANPQLRKLLQGNLQRRVLGGNNTYLDRLRYIICSQNNVVLGSG